MYNRTAAYDNIVSAMATDGPTSRPESINEPRRTVTKSSGFECVFDRHFLPLYL
jgi:hypothetical protein